MAQQWDTTLYDAKHHFVFQYGQGLLEELKAQPGERILDLGCGTGHLTVDIAALGAQVSGIDASESMIASAQANYPHIPFQVRSATELDYAGTLDAIFSNAVLHWIPEAEQVVIGVARSLKQGGRFVVEFGGFRNVHTVHQSLITAAHELTGIEVHCSLYFPKLGTYTALLEQHGLETRQAALYDRPTRLDGENGLQNWYSMFAVHLLEQIPAEQRQAVRERAEELARPTLYRDGVWYADYRRLRVIAVKL